MATQNTNTEINLSEFTSKLKQKDEKTQRTYAFLTIIGIIMTILYIMVIDFEKINVVSYFLPKFCCLIGSMGVYFITYLLYREFKMIDYSLPTYQLLKKAIKRYQFFSTKVKMCCLFCSVLFFCVFWEFNSNYLLCFLYTIGELIFIIILSYISWKKKYKPLRDNAKKLLKDLEE